MTELAVNDNGKGKYNSITVSLFDKEDIDFSYLSGSGETEHEAIDDFKKEFAEQFDKLLQIISDLNGNYKTVKVDWCGNKI